MSSGLRFVSIRKKLGGNDSVSHVDSMVADGGGRPPSLPCHGSQVLTEALRKESY